MAADKKTNTANIDPELLKSAKKASTKKGLIALTVVFSIISIVYLVPIFLVLINSFKNSEFVKSSIFALPFNTSENPNMWGGFDNFIKGLSESTHPFWQAALNSVIITVLSTVMILFFTTMAGWYIARVNSVLCKIIYFLCVFSMVVPFQMVQFALSQTADKLGLNTPWTIPVVYLGFGAGLAIFMFVGFVKSVPIDIEEAAAIDGCGPVRTYFVIVLPMLRPTIISVSILELMWIWNDYLLPFLALDKQYKTIPIQIKELATGEHGNIDYGLNMAMTLLGLIPIIVFYLACQKHIIKGVTAGAVKG